MVFIDRLRDQTNGEVNLLISATFNLKDSGYKLPIPIVTKHFNYFKPAWLEESISTSILKKSSFKEFTKQDVEYLIDLSGGLAVLVKSLVRDLSLNDKTLSDLDDLTFDEYFFEEYVNVKYSLDRIFQHLQDSTIETLIKIVNKQDISVNKTDIGYLSKVGILDDKNEIRGIILPTYIKSMFPSEVTGFHSQDTSYDNKSHNDFVSISDDVNIHKTSGEIYVNNEANGKYLSEKEFEIFELLYASRNKAVTRDDIAKILWEEDADNKYSDWAIDKTISRMREKINDTKPYKILKTLRGKGFLLVI